MSVFKGSIEPSNFKLGSTQLGMICKGLNVLWQNLVYKSGENAKKTFNLTRDTQTYTYTFDYPIKPKHIKGSGRLTQKDWATGTGENQAFVRIEINYVNSGWQTVYYEQKYIAKDGTWNWSTDKELTINELATQWRITKESRSSASGDSQTIYFTEWYEKPYTITYYLNGGTLPSEAPKKYLAFDGLSSLPEPTKGDYGFMGWYVSSDFSTDEVTSIAKGTTGNIKLYAKWGVWVEKTGSILYSSRGWGANANPSASWTGLNIKPIEIQTRWWWAGEGSGPTASFNLTLYFKDGTTGAHSFSGSGRDTTVTTTLSSSNQKQCTKIVLSGSDTVGAGVSTNWSDNYPKITKWKELEYQG